MSSFTTNNKTWGCCGETFNHHRPEHNGRRAHYPHPIRSALEPYRYLAGLLNGGDQP